MNEKREEEEQTVAC